MYSHNQGWYVLNGTKGWRINSVETFQLAMITIEFMFFCSIAKLTPHTYICLRVCGPTRNKPNSHFALLLVIFLSYWTFCIELCIVGLQTIDAVILQALFGKKTKKRNYNIATIEVKIHYANQFDGICMPHLTDGYCGTSFKVFEFDHRHLRW